MIESLFASPIYFNKVNNFLEIQSEITECIDNMEFSMKDEWGKTHFVISRVERNKGGNPLG